MPSRAEQLAALRSGVDEQAGEKEVETLVSSIVEARVEVEKALEKLTKASDALRTRARRIPNESANTLVVFSNAHLRFSGAASQGMKRTAALDRLLDKAKAEKEELARREELEKQAAARRLARKKAEQLSVLPPSDDAFESLYGEVVPNAE